MIQAVGYYYIIFLIRLQAFPDKGGAIGPWMQREAAWWLHVRESVSTGSGGRPFVPASYLNMSEPQCPPS